MAVQIGLHLLTGNTSSDQSMVDDGISPNSDEKRAKKEVKIEMLYLRVKFLFVVMKIKLR